MKDLKTYRLRHIVTGQWYTGSGQVSPKISNARTYARGEFAWEALFRSMMAIRGEDNMSRGVRMHMYEVVEFTCTETAVFKFVPGEMIKVKS